MAGIRVVVIEDDVFVAQDLVSSLEGMGYEVVGMAHSAEEGMRLLDSKTYDLALLDIQIDGGADGIFLAHHINRTSGVPIIFLTGMSDEVTLARARDCRPAAYMLKPFQARELSIAMELAVSNFSRGKIADFQASPEPEPEKQVTYQLNSRLFLRKRDRFERVDFQDILWAEAQSNYTEIVTQAEKFVMAVTLQEIEGQLQAPFFIRTHRSYIVNLNHVGSIAGNTLYIGDQAIPVSKSKRDLVFNYFTRL